MAVSKLHRTLRGRASLLSLDKCNKYLLHLQTVSSAFSVTVKVLGIFMRGGAVVELETNLREV